MGRIFKATLWLGFLGLVGIQFVPVDRSNPPVPGEISAPDQVMEVLRGACYDCHSNETQWPWYSRVAPVSWWIAQHVRIGRNNLNFSEWESMTAEDRAEARKDIWDEVEKGSMPHSDYLRMHPEAVLTEPQRQALLLWSEGRAREFPDWN
ncbi:MAG: heme-binding domain-containing protein [Gemmatimonadetes bacterium]|nr:heme-binding domain-containing protein [Gemmatimonadota bacterium]